MESKAIQFRVKNHFHFRRFNYISEPSRPYQLGDVITKPIIDDDQEPTGDIEVGVVIQTFSEGDTRTDMWGMACPSEGLRPSTLEEIKSKRPDILAELEITELVN